MTTIDRFFRCLEDDGACQVTNMKTSRVTVHKGSFTCDLTSTNGYDDAVLSLIRIVLVVWEVPVTNIEASEVVFDMKEDEQYAS